MVDVIQRLILEAETGDTKRQLSDVRKQQEQLAKAIKDAAQDTTKTKNETRELVDQYKSLVDTERRLEQQIRDTNDAYGDRRKALDAQEKFDRTSQGVALGGDVESNLRTVGGAAGAFGAGGLERGIGAVAEVPALVEALPRLKTAAAGLPSAIGQAASALGPAGVLVVGVAAGAAALVAIYKNSIKDQEKALQSLAQASSEFVNFAASGGTTQQAEERIAEEERLQDFANQEILRLEEEYQNNRFNLLDRFVNDGEQAIRDQIKDLEAQVRDSEANVNRFADAVEDGSLKTNDAAQAVQSATDAFEAVEQSVAPLKKETESYASTAQESAGTIALATQEIGQSAIALSQVVEREAGKSRSGGFSRRRGSSSLASPADSAIAEAEREAGNERLKLIKDFNQRELEIRKQSIFDQEQALERFRFDEQRLLETGSFSAAFDARREKAFDQKQSGDRLRFEAGQRSEGLQNDLAELISAFRAGTVVQVDVNSNVLNAQVRGFASDTVRRTSGKPFASFG